MAERVLMSNGQFEIDPQRMQHYVKQQKMNQAERQRIVDCRWAYLDWMHDHFADKVLPPPKLD